MFCADEEGHVFELEMEIVQANMRQSAQNTRQFKKAIMQRHQMEIMVNMGHLNHIFFFYPRDHFSLNMEQDHPFMQHVIMAHAVEQRVRDIL